MRSKSLALLLWGLIAAPAALAFGNEGHAAVGNLAEKLLDNTRAGAEVRQILHPGETLAFAAEWPDCARNVGDDRKHKTPKPKYQTEACTWYEKSLAAGVTELEAYVSRNWSQCEYAGSQSHCHKAFHFTNIPIQLGRYSPTSVGATRTDIVQAIRASVLLLRDGTRGDTFLFGEGMQGRREALRLLAHLVGDIHQPLHVGSVYLTAAGRVVDPNRSKRAGHWASNNGGDLLELDNGWTMHSLWDSVDKSITGQDLAGEAGNVEDSVGSAEAWAEQWARESILQARAAFRGLVFEKKAVEVIEGKQKAWWPVRMKDEAAYTKARMDMQRLQIVRGGTRLADLLQAIWPD